MLTFMEFLEMFCMAMMAVLIPVLIGESILLHQGLKEIKARHSQLTAIDELCEELKFYRRSLKKPFPKHNGDKNQRSSKQSTRRYNGWGENAVNINTESGNILELRRPFKVLPKQSETEETID